MLFHDIHQGGLHELVETGQLLIDQTFVIEKGVDYCPNRVLRQFGTLGIELGILVLDCAGIVTPIFVALSCRSRSVTIAVVTCL
jgi:hypothetical protein